MAEYLKVFDTHSEYEAYIGATGALFPNVSTCKDVPKVVHYNPLPDILSPEVWEEYQQYICNDEALEYYLENIFSKYEVTMTQLNGITVGGSINEPDLETVVDFEYTNNNNETYRHRITLTRTSGGGYSYPQTTNDCGKTYYNIGNWELQGGGGQIS